MYKKQNLFQRIVFSRGMALLLIFFIVFVGYGLVSVARKSIEASSARKIAETQNAELKAKEADLSSKITSLQTPEGQEAALREQYPVVKEGEHVVVITDDASDSQPDTPQVLVPPSSAGFWNFLRHLFKRN